MPPSNGVRGPGAVPIYLPPPIRRPFQPTTPARSGGQRVRRGQLGHQNPETLAPRAPRPRSFWSHRAAPAPPVPHPPALQEPFVPSSTPPGVYLLSGGAGRTVFAMVRPHVTARGRYAQGLVPPRPPCPNRAKTRPAPRLVARLTEGQPRPVVALAARASFSSKPRSRSNPLGTGLSPAAWPRVPSPRPAPARPAGPPRPPGRRQRTPRSRRPSARPPTAEPRPRCGEQRSADPPPLPPRFGAGHPAAGSTIAPQSSDRQVLAEAGPGVKS